LGGDDPVVKRGVVGILVLTLFFTWIFTINPDDFRVDAVEEWQFIHFSQPATLGELIYEVDITPAIELWHYSGGYWEGRGVRIYDKDAGTGWNDPDYIADVLGVPVDFAVSLPNIVRDKILEFGMDGIEVVIQFNDEYAGIDLLEDNMFRFDTSVSINTSINPKYQISNQELIFEALPKFNCAGDYNYTGVNKTIPKVKEGYGRNVYSLFYKTGGHAGRILGTHSGEGGMLDYNIILDRDGNLESGHQLDIYDEAETLKVIGSCNSSDVTIGKGTFNNAGAVGMQFWYPMKISIYAKGNDAAKAHIKHFKADGTPLTQYNYTSDLSFGEDYTFNPTNVYKHEFVGSNIDFDTEATGINPGSGEHTFNYDGSFENVYINYYYNPQVGGSGNRNEPLSTGYIMADERGTERFDVSKGIPVLEDLYVNLFGKEYLFEYSFKENIGSNEYTVNVNKTYNLRWQEDDGDFDEEGVWQSDWNQYSSSETVTKEYNIIREYSYWTIENLEIYKLNNGAIINPLLPGGALTITPYGYTSPLIDLWNSDNIDDHIDHPVTGEVTINLNSQTINGGKGGEPNVPNEDWSARANNEIGEIKARNDRLIFNSATIMDDRWIEKTTQSPSDIPDAPITDNNVFYQRGITIDTNKANGTYPSTGNISYTKIASVNSTSPVEINDTIIDFNSVVVHTPVVCNTAIWNDSANNQEINPDNTRAAIILDRPFSIQVPNSGQHNNILGYGNRNYRKYTQDKEVRFPFDVYLGISQSGTYIKANTWHSIPVAEELITFYLPIWVDEGNYEVEFRQTAINATDGAKKNKKENLANININNYVATKEIPVRAIGRLYGFKITDIMNYPLWQQVFRQNLDTSNHSGNYYWVGTRDQEGNNRGNTNQFTLPLLEGSHPNHKNIGALKTGYTFKFQLDTIGNYFGEQAAISINPSFYFVNADGTENQEVDLWYSEAFGGEENHFIKVGNNILNRQNTKYIKLGDIYRNVPESEIKDTSRILGIDKNIFKNQDSKLGWFDWIVLSKPLRTFIGNIDNLPQGVDSDKVKQSAQRWYGEYYLPNTLYVAPKGYDVIQHSRTNNGLTGRESFWLKEGYIIVNFKIETIKSGNFSNPILGYWNGPLANMWSKEGFKYSKTDNNGITFNLKNGDVIFYYANKKASDDYESGGTH